MSSHNEQLEPTPFELAPGPEPEKEISRSSPSPWVLPALAGLALLAMLVFFWLPEQVGESTPAPAALEQDTASPAQPPASPQATPAKADTSPWSDAQEAKLRSEAQEVLQALLDLQFALEDRGAGQWADPAWSAATATAQNGDELYRQREYIASREKYAQGLAQFQAIEDSIPDIVDQQLELARDGLEAGDQQQVSNALELVALIEPENGQLSALQQRAAVMAPLLALLEQAADAEAGGDLSGAQQQLQQATALDPEHQHSANELARVNTAYLEQQFNDAMSLGYTALDKRQFDSAREHFRRAAGLKPGSSEAANALQEVVVAQQGDRLATLKSRGAKLESNEQWQGAVDAYEQALETDSSLLFASEGLKRSQARARLDKQFRSAINQPERLSDIAVAEATGKLLQQAQTIAPRGPLLTEQIETLDRLLEQANTLVPVTLRSDGETEVIVYKVARLGRFQEKQLTLRPGTYQARGSRVGYRDVLQKFTVSHEGAGPPLHIICSERIL